ncbi:MAG: hypothetical protein Alpg2KO_31140 [Alphaproteobacteria bacterium]
MFKTIASLSLLVFATVGLSACAMMHGSDSDMGQSPPPWERNNHAN